MFGRKQRRIEELEHEVINLNKTLQQARRNITEEMRWSDNRLRLVEGNLKRKGEEEALKIASRLEREVKYLRGDSTRPDRPLTQPVFGGGS